MEKDDVRLINRILSGDDTAFSDLVYKYQNSVHALVWRKIGDFQIAEEIAQDTFLQAYQKLATLKNPTQLAGWLYVIASNLCTDWKRRKKPIMKSLESDTSGALEKTSYERYIEEQREIKAAEHRRELIKNLLDKLPESERTVVTLHYLGEMTSESISKFLGVSVNTIKSRLRRARKRLQKEEPMIRETLGNVKLPANFVDSIMKMIEKTTPTPTTNSQPLIPWAAFGTAVLLVILLMGTSSQYLSSFQQPYSLESQSETAIKIVDASVVLDIQTKPELQKRNESSVIARENDGIGQKEVDNAIVADTDADSSRVAIQQNRWNQVQGPPGGDILDMFLTSDGNLLVVAPTGIYKTTSDANEWILINNTLPTDPLSKTPIAEYKNTLYIATDPDIFASNDGGMNWISIAKLEEEGAPIAFLTTDNGFYLVLEKGIYKSVDEGRQWSMLKTDLKDSEITAATNIGNTVFVATEHGLYRIKSGKWQHLLDGEFKTPNSLAAADNTLYAGILTKSTENSSDTPAIKQVKEMLLDENSKQWELYSSDDLGDTWKKITPKHKHIVEEIKAMGINILASNQTIIAIGLYSYRSRDKGLTWIQLDSVDTASLLNGIDDAEYVEAGVDGNIFYIHGYRGIQRTTNDGESWHQFMDGIIGTEARELVSLKNRLYANISNEIIKSDDNGETWTSVRTAYYNDKPLHQFRSPLLTIADNTLYAIAGNFSTRPTICRLSESGDVILPIPEIPAIEKKSYKGMSKENTEAISIREELSDLQQRYKDLADPLKGIDIITSMAISGKTFYVVYNSRLLKWKQGLTKWVDTGLDTGEGNLIGFWLASSGKTVYVGSLDGRLFQSLNEGENWTDITTELPIQCDGFFDITFSGSRVFIATDKGVLTSPKGKQWRVIKDQNGKNVWMQCLVDDGSEVYGAQRSSIYRFNSNKYEWERISPEVPGSLVQNIDVHNDKLYITTHLRGIFHIPVKQKTR